MPFLIALSGCAALALIWLLFPHRFDPSDPWAYSLNAWEISRGLGDFLATAPNHPFAHRLAVTVPVAGLYAVFGANVWTTHLWPLLCAFFIVAALCAALPANRERALAVFLCVTCVGLFRQTTALYADIVATGLIFPAAVALYHRGSKRPWAALALPLAFSLLTFAAFLAKETAYWILPVWIYALASDLRAGGGATARRFHLFALAALAVLGAAYMLFCARAWGHPLARLISVQDLTGHHLWSWQNAGAYDWFKRLALSPVKLMLLEYGPATALAALAVRLSPRKYLFWSVYSGSMILLFWFGSTAFTRYEPLPALPRMVLPAIPGLFVLAAGLAPRLAGPRASNGIRGAFIASVLPFAVHAFAWDRSPDPREGAVEFVMAELRSNPRVLLLTADVRSPRHLAFYFGYRVPAGLVIRDVEEAVRQGAPPIGSAFDAAYLFSYPALSRVLFENAGNQNFEARIDAMRLPLAWEQAGMRVLRVPDPGRVIGALRQSN